MAAIKLGVWGLGRIGRVHCANFSNERKMYRLVAVCDKDRNRLKETGEKFDCAVYDSAKEFLNNADMELAIIATRSLDHVSHALQALAAGKYVLLEKPIAVTNNDLKKLQQADRKYPGKLFFLHNHRFEPAFQHILKIIGSGILGSIHTAKLCRHHPFGRRGDWQAFLSYGGGQLNCWGPHIIDHALQLMGAPVKSVWSNLKSINTLGDGDDHLKIILVGENEVVVDLEISYAMALQGALFTVHGDRGSLVCPDGKSIQLKYINPKFKFKKISANRDLPLFSGGFYVDEKIPWIQKTIKVKPDTNMWVQVEIDTARHLYKAIRNKIPFPIANADAMEVVRITQLVKKQNGQFKWIK